MVLRHTLAALIQQKLFIYITLIHYAEIPHHLILFVLLYHIFFYHVYLSIVQQLVSIIISRFQSNLHQPPQHKLFQSTTFTLYDNDDNNNVYIKHSKHPTTQLFIKFSLVGHYRVEIVQV